MSNGKLNGGTGGVLLVKKVRGKVSIFQNGDFKKNENVELHLEPPQSFYAAYKDEAAMEAKRQFKAALISKALIMPLYKGNPMFTGDIKDMDNIRIQFSIKEGSNFKEKAVVNVHEFKKGDIIIKKDQEVIGIYFVVEGIAGCDESGRKYGDDQDRQTFGFLSKANDGKATVDIVAETDVKVKIINFKFGKDESSQMAEELLYEGAEIAVQVIKENETLELENQKLKARIKELENA